MELDDATLEFAHSVFELAREGGAEQLAGYLDAGLSPDLTTGTGDTLLILAAYHAQEETVRALLACGADTARVNDRGQTALGSAAFRQAGGIVRALLVAGADPYLGSPSAVAVARFFDLPEMLALLVPSGGAGGEPAGGVLHDQGQPERP